MGKVLSARDQDFVDKAVSRYLSNKIIFDALATAIFETITQNKALNAHVHSVKYRVKDPGHFKQKLERKIAERGRKSWGITEVNLFQKVNDLVGLRILHLHTSQMQQIDRELQRCMASEDYQKIEGPTAKTWDLEYKNYFNSIGIATEESPSQYTSVHYVYSARNDLKQTFEIQVRTLAEELWGEVNHQINYPDPHPSVTCKEQIAVLARVTSSCTRLVDSIKRSELEHDAAPKRLAEPKKKNTYKKG
jgi:putative GTP pyrophosphokinase